MPRKKLKVLVVDDTIVYRKAVSDALASFPGVEVVGVAHNGKIALHKIKILKPDLLTLDIEMPEMNGIEVLKQLQTEAPNVGVIMVSTLTQEGGDMTMKALSLGAFDFIRKPQSNNILENKRHLKSVLAPMIRVFQQTQVTVGSQCQNQKTSAPKYSGRSTYRSAINTKVPSPTRRTKENSTIPRHKSEIVTIGISTGGPNALAQMLPQLPGNIGVPIVIVQHMPAVFTKSLAKNLNSKCALTVKEAEDSENIKPNYVYIAPGGKQMKLVAGANGKNRKIRITNDPPENSCKPAVDYLFRSVGDYYVGRATAVIMTGMGKDGNKGLESLKQKGAHIIAQDKNSCVVYGMPKDPVEKKIADVVVPLNKIAGEIMQSVQ